MKLLRDLLLTSSHGVIIPGILYGLILMIFTMPTQFLADQGDDDFPDNRQGGGTHIVISI
ncbi:MAG: hypothetical protein AAGE59_08640 [Cyanobacteria bacterium P01_F01_bin.86]